jgi:hypothetical protein
VRKCSGTVAALIAVAEERIHAAAEQQSAPVEPATVDSPSMHEDLIRERTELDKLRRRFARERTEVETARAGLRRELEKARREEDRSTTAQLARRVAEGLRLRLDEAGIEQQEVAQVAGLSASAVCRVLAGRSVSIAVVAAAERLLRKPQRRPAEAAR